MAAKGKSKTRTWVEITVSILSLLVAIAALYFDVCSGNKNVSDSPPSVTTQTDSSSAPQPNGPGITGDVSPGKPDSSRHSSDPPKGGTTSPLPIPPAETTPATYYQIKVHVSSRMKDAHFFVDNEPAQIIDDMTTVKVIRIKKKDSNHTISVKKDSIECSKQLFINQNNVVVTLCP